MFNLANERVRRTVADKLKIAYMDIHILLHSIIWNSFYLKPKRRDTSCLLYLVLRCGTALTNETILSIYSSEGTRLTASPDQFVYFSVTASRRF